jgi:hypothetical protein
MAKLQRAVYDRAYSSQISNLRVEEAHGDIVDQRSTKS